MGAPAATQSNSTSPPQSSRHERNLKLMHKLGVEYYEPVPKDQLLTFMSQIYQTPRRILAWVHERILCHPVSSDFCIDNSGNALQQKDCLRSLNEAACRFSKGHGTKPVVLDKSAISRGFAVLKKFGLVRFDNEQGRIYLCGKVTPTPEAYKLSDENSIPPALRELLNQLPAGERTVIIQGLHERQAQLKDAMAAAVRKVRQEHRQAEDEFLAEHGIAKAGKGKKYTRLHVPATPPTENQPVTDEELHVRATGEPRLPAVDSWRARRRVVTSCMYPQLNRKHRRKISRHPQRPKPLRVLTSCMYPQLQEPPLRMPRRNLAWLFRPSKNGSNSTRCSASMSRRPIKSSKL